MSVKTTFPLLNTVQDTTRGPSPVIWGWQGGGNPGVWEFIPNPQMGLHTFDDFKAGGITPGTGSAATFVSEQAWYAYADTNGAITDSGIIGGGIHLAASTTAHQGVALGSLTNAYQIVTAGGALQGRLAFETRVQLSTASIAASTADVFVGLVDASGLPASAVPITNTGGSLATAAGFIGFHKRGGSTGYADWNFVWNVAGGTPVYGTGLTTLVNTVLGSALAGATYYKLGFVFDAFQDNTPMLVSTQTSGGAAVGSVVKPMVRIYVNGLLCAVFLDNSIVTGSAFPTTLMAPAIAFKQQSTTASVSCDVDWIRVAQTLLA